MSLRKSPTLTPALWAANRRNARKSTGPRAARGKARSRLNGLRRGTRSLPLRDLVLALLNAPPCAVDATARAVLTPEPAAHPLFAEIVEIARRRKSGSPGHAERLARVEK